MVYCYRVWELPRRKVVQPLWKTRYSSPTIPNLGLKTCQAPARKSNMRLRPWVTSDPQKLNPSYSSRKNRCTHRWTLSHGLREPFLFQLPSSCHQWLVNPQSVANFPQLITSVGWLISSCPSLGITTLFHLEGPPWDAHALAKNQGSLPALWMNHKPLASGKRCRWHPASRLRCSYVTKLSTKNWWLSMGIQQFTNLSNTWQVIWLWWWCVH